ncbi:MAG: hypothetical protein HY834_14805 [Devosia nanyangense]|uniref:Uncharacterized protein n=1 Tax=Devosia nanyangense TaxID=1228055 RepID=A0A933L4J0_9HYPH|nr:hypothetical protein [Devosia nanyangense]
MTQLSRRGYARTRGVSEATVRKHIASGVLAGAVDPATGLLDADLADKLLAGSIVRPKAQPVPAVLKNARARHDLEVALLAELELDELRQDLRNVDELRRLRGVYESKFAEVTRRCPARWAPLLSGRPAADVVRMLKLLVNQLLTELSTPGIADAEYEQAEADLVAEGLVLRERPPLSLDGLTPVELKAVLLNQATEKLRYERGQKLGFYVWESDVVREYETELAVFKSALVALPGRVAVLVEYADVAETQALLSREVELAIAVLETPKEKLT